MESQPEQLVGVVDGHNPGPAVHTPAKLMVIAGLAFAMIVGLVVMNPPNRQESVAAGTIANPPAFAASAQDVEPDHG